MKKLGNIFILGDSYSTFEGCIPADCWCWYFRTPHDDTDVVNPEETWWHLLLENTESHLVLNCSSSGTTLCHTGYDGVDWSDGISFCARLDGLANAGFFEKNRIDTFFLFGGTNDSWADSPLGELKYGEKTREDLFSVLPAYCHLIETAKKHCPDARIITVVNTELKPEITDCFTRVSAHYGTEVIALRDIEKQSGHPNRRGMEQIFRQVLEQL